MTGAEYTHINDVIEDLYELGKLTEEDFCNLCRWIDEADRLEKCRWHDLRKDSNDLPKDLYSVFICIKGFEGRRSGVTIAMHNSKLNIWGSTSCSYEDYEVSGWREIDTFE